jgi:hypothetical protein
MSPPSAREAALLALHQRLQAVPDGTVLRNEVLPAKIPAGGLVILRDGDPGEPEVTLNPVTYLWQHRAEIEVVVEAATAAARDAALDALLVAIGETLASDPIRARYRYRDGSHGPWTQLFTHTVAVSARRHPMCPRLMSRGAPYCGATRRRRPTSPASGCATAPATAPAGVRVRRRTRG